MSDKPSGSGSAWNHNPRLPIQTAPYFDWPPRPGAIVKWLASVWFPVSERLFIIGIACATWFYCTPALERCRDFTFGWIGEVYLRNLALMVIVAGGFHLYLYTFAKQGKRLKFSRQKLIGGGLVKAQVIGFPFIVPVVRVHPGLRPCPEAYL